MGGAAGTKPPDRGEGGPAKMNAGGGAVALHLPEQQNLFLAAAGDDTNNTPTRIDRNELYVDIAIVPIKSVVFIYIPIRIKNTGEIAKLGN